MPGKPARLASPIWFTSRSSFDSGRNEDDRQQLWLDCCTIGRGYVGHGLSISAKNFGEQVAHIVEGVTRLDAIDFATREEQQAETFARCAGDVDDIRVVLIKLADRLHNMRTLEHLQPDRGKKCPGDA